VTKAAGLIGEAKTADEAKALAQTHAENNPSDAERRAARFYFYSLVLHPLRRRRLASAKIFP